jgi:multiple sugar transport system substrate-binding protein
VLEKWKEWIEKGYWYPDPRARTWPEGLGLLAEGQAAMAFIGTYATSVLDDAGKTYGEDYDLFVFPQINGDYPTTLTGPFDGLSIAQKAANPKGAERLLAFMATTEAQSIRAEAGGLVLNKLVESYGPAMQNVKAAIDAGATFQPGFFQATPPIGLELINLGAMPDFYDDPDIGGFIRRANDAREQFMNE